MLGAIYLAIIFYQKIQTGKATAKKQYIHIGLLLFLISFISLVSLTYNNTNDLEFLKYPISVCIAFLATFFILKSFNFLKVDASQKNVMLFIVYTATLQSAISLFLFLSPSAESSLNAVLNMSDLKSTTIERVSGTRIVGFSRSFFEAGIFSGMALLLTGYLIRYYHFKSKALLMLAIIYLFIFAIGVMMARTTLVGASLSLVLILMPRNVNISSLSRKPFRFIFFTALVLFVVIISLSTVSFSFLANMKQVLNFGFELFINIAEKGSVETSSTDTLMTMFILPDSGKTWLIGDGLWSTNNGMSYYMNTDVGYSRLIYYFGTLGFFTFFIYQLVLIKSAIRNSFAILIFFYTFQY